MSDSLIDCDTHFWQPFEVWESHVDRRRKDAVATWLDDHDPYKTLDPEVTAVLRKRMLENPADDPKARLEWLDSSNIGGNVIYPGSGLVSYSANPEVAAAACRALNRWAADFADTDRSRLKPCMSLPWRFPDLVIEELRYAREELGLGIIFAAPTPDPKRRWSDPALDPVWAEIESSQTVMTFHEFTRLEQDAPLVARETYQDSYALSYVCGHCVEAQLSLLDIIGGGVLERFPDLQLGIVEAHTAWLPGWLALLDGLWPRISTGFKTASGTGSLPLTPTEYFRRQCFIVSFPDDAWVEETVKYVGERNVMLCTDYPHPQERDAPVETLDEHAPGLTPQARSMVLRENAMRVFGFGA
ncbi:MAG: amidohydrolase family protein [Deltaproteobacteria bacterium]|jgi:predicted TIM-barrel fold metal-dependent hydrolase|nr:amidohydrolase family protein [Deltaproteobacteria bacterium]